MPGMYNAFWSKVTDILNASIVGRVYLAVVHWISGAFKNSWFYSFFASKDMADYGKSSKISTFFEKIAFKSKFSEFVSQSYFINFIANIPDMVLASPVYVLSFYMLPSSLLLFIRYFGNVPLMVVFALSVIIAVILLGFRASIASVLSGSLAFRTFCDFFCIDLKYKSRLKPIYVSLVASMVGVFVGLFSFVLGDTLSVVAFLGVLFLPLLLSHSVLLSSFSSVF